MHVIHHFIRTVIPLISAFLYNGARNSSSLSSSGGATNHFIWVIIWVFFFNSNIQINLLTFWNDTGIHECGECKVGDNEESNETLIGWYPFVVVNVVLTWIVEKGECRAKKQQPGKCCWYHSCLHIFFHYIYPTT